MVWCNGQTFLNCRTPFPPIDIIFLCCTVVKVASRFKIFPDRGVTRWPWIQNLCNSVILDVSTWNKNGNVGHNNGSVIYPNIISVSYWYSEILASTQSPIAISFVCCHDPCFYFKARSCNSFVCIIHFDEYFDNCQSWRINWTLVSIVAAGVLVLYYLQKWFRTCIMERSHGVLWIVNALRI